MPSTLQTFPAGGLAHYLSQLPPELITSILRQLHPFLNPPKQCTYLISPTYWLQALLDKSLLPWLWDLDVEAITRKQDSAISGQQWDWELLLRQLAQNDDYEQEPVSWAMDEIPLSLRNRRRIWDSVSTILDEDIC
ncbi:hypothetical protein N7G274_002239 [Stereocaulon virgatum]|uniref:F-box domain-containing protein n=1 Tax=Stereocaulon virgatum TaxID=373712 RepID=A0ABR4AP12_9LECA